MATEEVVGQAHPLADLDPVSFDAPSPARWIAALAAVQDGSGTIGALSDLADSLPPTQRRAQWKDLQSISEVEANPILEYVGYLDMNMHVQDRPLVARVLSNRRLANVSAFECWQSSHGEQLVRKMVSSSLPSLDEITFRDSRLSFGALSVLLEVARFSSPLRLRVAGANLKSKGVERLAAQPFPRLRLLDLMYSLDKISPGAVKKMTAAPWHASLESVHLGTRDFMANPKAWQYWFENAPLAAMRELNVEMAVSDDNLAALARRPLPALQRLRIADWEQHAKPRAVLDFLRTAEMPRLVSLDLGDVPLSAELASTMLERPWYAGLTELHPMHDAGGLEILRSHGPLPFESS